MQLEKVSPTKLLLPQGVEDLLCFAKLKKALSYEDKRITYEYLNWKKVKAKDDTWLLSLPEQQARFRRHWFPAKFGASALTAKVKELDKARFKSCLFEEKGRYYTYTGLQNLIEDLLDIKTITTYELPEWKELPWVKAPPPLRWYQDRAVDLMTPEDKSVALASIQAGTGLGKSLILAKLLKRIGLPGIVIVPTLAIGRQLLKDCKRLFGNGKVGQFFGSKKEPSKHIVIAVSKSLMNVNEGTKEWNLLSKKQILLGDECHTVPPDSLQSVVFGLLKDIPYRYWVSGTAFRNDGLQLLLDAITGPIVFEMTVRQGIEEGFLSPLKFFQYRIKTDYTGKPIEDPIKATRVNLHQNKNVYKHVSGLINHAVKEKGRRVLVQVDTLDQFKYLLDGGLVVESRFAHGGTTKDNRDTVPEAHWKSDPMDLVEKFDNGEFPVLVGTSAIGTGVDVKSCNVIVNLVGLSSEIEITQNIGRGTRLFPGKTECIYIDYDVIENKAEEDGKLWTLSRHAAKRREIFNSIYGECRVLDAKI